MNELERRTRLLELGKRQIDIAQEMSDEFGITLMSAKVVVSEMISGRDFYPKYAKWLKDKYKIVIERPDWMKPFANRLQQAA